MHRIKFLNVIIDTIESQMYYGLWGWSQYWQILVSIVK